MLLHSLARPAGSLVRMIGRLRRCNRGVAAVEFGMIVPIMFMLFVGAVEFSQAITVDRRVEVLRAAAIPAMISVDLNIYQDV